MKKTIAVVVAIWLICGIFNVGATYAHFQNKFPSIAERERSLHAWVALLYGAGGPCSTIGVILAQRYLDGSLLKYGWRLSPLSALLGK